MQRQQSNGSLNTMSSFNQNFEAHVNENMNEDTQPSSSQDHKGKMPARSPSPSMAEDGEFNEKMAMKDRGQEQLPPRFSTIFQTKLPTTPTKAFESYPQYSNRHSGIYVPKAVFWALLAIFLFETAALFAYTVIGLVSNMPSRLPPNTAVVSGCDCSAQPINISPNFFMPQAPDMESPTTSIEATTTSTSSSTSTTSSTSSSTASVDASKIVDIFKSAAELKSSASSTSTRSKVTAVITPPGPTIQSTTLLTVDASGNPVKPRPTVTSTQFAEPSASLSTRDEPSVSTSNLEITSNPEKPVIVPITTQEGSGGIVVSVSMAPDSDPTRTPLIITPISTNADGGLVVTALRSHRELANKPTQQLEAEAEPAAVTPSPEVPESEDSVSLSSAR